MTEQETELLAAYAYLEALEAEEKITEMLKRPHGRSTITGLQVHTHTLANSDYPNAVLLDGSRSMTGDLTLSADSTLNAGSASKQYYQIFSNFFIMRRGTDLTKFWQFYADEAWRVLLTYTNGASVTDMLDIRGDTNTIILPTDCNLKIQGSSGILLTDNLQEWGANHEITMISPIKVNTIHERTAASGVTIDGVLCKDNVVPDSAYPNGLLLDGSRSMSAAIKFSGGNEIWASEFPGTIKFYGNTGAYTATVIAYEFCCDLLRARQDGDVSMTSWANAARLFKFIGWSGVGWFDLATFGYSQGFTITPRSVPASPVEGSMYWDSVAHKLKVYNGSAWETVTSS